MTRRGFRGAIVLTSVLMWCHADALTAEPIKAAFHVRVVERYSFARDITLPFASEFELIAEFDDRVTFSSEFEDFRFVAFGTPRFSIIPLTPAGEVPGQHAAETYVIEIGGQQGGNIYREGFGPDGYSRRAGVSGRTEPPAYPFTVEGLLGLIERTGHEEPNFIYEATLRNPVTFEFSEDSYHYKGFATLSESAAPIPEPASLLLLGSGLAGIAIRACRHRHLVSQRDHT